MRKAMVLVLGVSGCSSTLPAPVIDTQNRVVDIVNTTDSQIQFSAVNTERHGLSRQRTHETSVEANYYQTLNFDDETGACLFDLSAELDNGQTAAANRFNTCKETAWVVR